MAKFNLQEALKGLKVEDAKAAPRPCPKCGEHDADGPCYGYDCSTYEPDFDCSAEIPQECDTCLYIACEGCRMKLVKEILPDHLIIKKEALFKLIDAANAKWDCASTNAAMRELMTSIELLLEK